MAKKLSTTPKGTLVYPWLTGKADTKFKDAGEWKTGLRVLATDKGAIKLIDEIDMHMKSAFNQAKADAKTPKAIKAVKMCEDKPYRMETDDDDTETGYVIFNFKMRASGKNKKTGEEFTRKPALFDAKGEVIVNPPKIGAGTLAKVSFEFYEFPPAGKTGAGVSLRLEGVQVITLVEWGVGSAEDHGFEDESEEDEAEVDEDGAEEEEEDEADDDEAEEEEEEEEEDEEEEAPAPAVKAKTKTKAAPAPVVAAKPVKKGNKKSKDDF